MVDLFKKKPPKQIKVVSPLNGSIGAIVVKDGENIVKGQTIMIIDSAEYEHEITAPVKGVVTAIPLLVGSEIEKGDVLLTIN